MKPRYLPVTVMIAILLALWGFSIDRVIGVAASYYLSLGLFVAAFGLGFLKFFPFNSNGQLARKFKETATFILLIAWPVACVTEMMDRGPVQFWFPTNNTFWAALPVFMIAGFAWSKGIRPE